MRELTRAGQFCVEPEIMFTVDSTSAHALITQHDIATILELEGYVREGCS